MVAFPLGWGEWVDRLGPPSDGCPVSPTGMLAYLANCEEHYSRDERRYEFGEPVQIERREVGAFTLWLWTSNDTTGREWYIVIGSGLGDAARNSVHRTRWLLAETSEDRSPAEFMEDAISELMGSEEAP